MGTTISRAAATMSALMLNPRAQQHPDAARDGGDQPSEVHEAPENDVHVAEVSQLVDEVADHAVTTRPAIFSFAAFDICMNRFNVSSSFPARRRQARPP